MTDKRPSVFDDLTEEEIKEGNWLGEFTDDYIMDDNGNMVPLNE